MYQSINATDAVDSITPTESAKEKKIAHYAQETAVSNNAQLHHKNTNALTVCYTKSTAQRLKQIQLTPPLIRNILAHSCTRKVQEKYRVLNYNLTTTRNMANTQREQINCYQINLQHSKVATENLMQIIAKGNTDMIMTQEPYIYQDSPKRITRG